ncbi:solute carrier family 24 [Capsaspora owczarzaki ATCC 30864]|uniref:solute carrier family 24 n=1 Tax=Capsaspora owczarzaki (strain ATCC 30864) TaxID=595528 RepID=UPI00035235B8|nr:solute carrier family 24 [Capsaspora owczarzaki ATCC 30864]|eukprot:XP_004343855.2 solute carrier family 24 [Capsaspora owczarzaki ATCC 30864]
MPLPAAMFILLFWLAFLFVMLGVTAQDYFVPALTVISDFLHLSQNVAGVTFLAFGNGAPDIFSVIAALTAAKDGAGFAVGELFGAGVFLTTVLVGAVSLVGHIKLTRRPFLRDVSFNIVTVSLILLLLWQGKIYLWQGACFIAIYTIYVCTVVFGRRLYQARKLKREAEARANGEVVDKPDRKSRDSDVSGDVSVAGGINSTGIAISVEPVDMPSTPTTPTTDEIDPDADGFLGHISRSIRSKSMKEVTENHHSRSRTTSPRPSGQHSIEAALSPSEALTTSLLGHPVLSSVPAGKAKTPRTSFVKDEHTPLMRTESDEQSLASTLSTTLPTLVGGLMPVDLEAWENDRWFHKAFQIFKIPIYVMLNPTCPVIDKDEQMHNWNKNLYVLQCLLAPIVGVLLTNLFATELGGGFTVWMLALIAGVLLSALVFFTSEYDRPPKYHTAFAFVGFAVAVVWIYATANEIVDLLETFGRVLTLSDALLGLTVLALGNSIGDMLLGIGLASIVACTTIEDPYPFEMSSHMLASGLFFLGSLISSLIYVPLNGFGVGRKYGIYLLVLYTAFFVTSITLEFV